MFYFSVVLVHTGTVSPKYPIPSKDWKDWDEKGPNELTAMGMREQYILGYELRRRYNHTIDQDYFLDQIYVRMVDHNNTIMSGQAFLRGFLRDNTERLTDGQLNKADPPIAIDSYFKQQIGHLVLPSGVSTLPFHTYYPHENDVLDSCYCELAHQKNLETFNRTKEVQEIINKNFGWFSELAKEFKDKIRFPEDIDLLESIHSAIHQFKKVNITANDTKNIKDFTEKLYIYARAVDNESVKYQTSEAFDFLNHFIKNTTEVNAKNLTHKQNRRIAFLFIEDIMMVNILKRLSIPLGKILPSSSILTFKITGTTTEPEQVHITFNDNEPKKFSYKEFLKKLEDYVVKDKKEIKDYCTPKT